MAAAGLKKEQGLTQFDCQGQMVPAVRCLSRLLQLLFGNLPDVLFHWETKPVVRLIVGFF